MKKSRIELLIENPALMLDFDGVVNSISWAIRTKQRGIWGIDVDTLPFLEQIVVETRCNIIITSAKRVVYDLVDFRREFRNAGFKQWDVIRDCTPRIGTKGSIRGDEVKAWIDNLHFVNPYACLDDSVDYYPDQPLVRTDLQLGLTQKEADKCIEILTKKV